MLRRTTRRRRRRLRRRRRCQKLAGGCAERRRTACACILVALSGVAVATAHVGRNFPASGGDELNCRNNTSTTHAKLRRDSGAIAEVQQTEARQFAIRGPSPATIRLELRCDERCVQRLRSRIATEADSRRFCLSGFRADARTLIIVTDEAYARAVCELSFVA